MLKGIVPKIKDFWSKNEAKVVLCAGMILVSIVSFEFGLVQGKKSQIRPVIIEKTAQAQEASSQGCSVMPSGAQNLTQEVKNTLPSTNAPIQDTATGKQNCAFVGSKNSNKFYPPTCSYAKRIKPENIVCFATAQEALAQGRIESTGCK